MANRSYKGRRFELWLATELSQWWTNGERDDVFYHTHDSGGRATRRHAKGKKTYGLYGDIHAVDPVGKPLMDLVVIECKRGYNQATIADLLDKPARAAKQAYEKWIAKAREDAKAAGVPYWLLIHKRDKRESLVVIPTELEERICQYGGLSIYPPYPELFFIDKGGISVTMTTLSDFFSQVTPEQIDKVVACQTRKKRSG